MFVAGGSSRIVSPQSNWASVRKDSAKFLQDTKYNRAMGVYTINDPKSPYGDWKVKVKLIWERDFPFRDIVVKRTLPFHNCGGDAIGLP